MSRRITIKTALDNPDLVRAALSDLNAQFEQVRATYFKVKRGVVDYHNDGEQVNFRYTGVTIDTETGVASYDEDCSNALEFVNGPLRQMYSKNLFLTNSEMEGETLINELVVDDVNATVDGWIGDLDAGDIVFRSKKMYAASL